jgi:hypothetical protein
MEGFDGPSNLETSTLSKAAFVSILLAGGFVVKEAAIYPDFAEQR